MCRRALGIAVLAGWLSVGAATGSPRAAAWQARGQQAGASLTTRSPVHRMMPGPVGLAGKQLIRVWVYGDDVSGLAEPGAVVSVKVWSGDGSLKGQASGTASANPNHYGMFNVIIRSGREPVSIDPGDMVEVDLSAGDPVSLQVPLITATTDESRDLISGEAPPGAQLTVTAGTSAAPVQQIVAADSRGHYRADFSGLEDIRAPYDGGVVLTDERGREFATGWSAVQLSYNYGPGGATLTPGPQVVDPQYAARGRVGGNGPFGRRVQLRLRSPQGELLASGETRIGLDYQIGLEGGGGRYWGATLIDNAGQPFVAQPGDVLEAIVGDDKVEFTLPRLSAAVFLDSDTVRGQTEPGATVGVYVETPSKGDFGQQIVTADATGRFEANFASKRDILANDIIRFDNYWRGHVVFADSYQPGMSLDLDEATLTGVLYTPNSDVEGRLLAADGSQRARNLARTREDGSFLLRFRNGAGEAILPQANDMVQVVAAGEPATEIGSFRVPMLTLQLPQTGGQVGGTVSPVGALQAWVQRPFVTFVYGDVDARPAHVGADGTWVVDFPFNSPFTARAGQQVGVMNPLPEGHLVRRTIIVPQLNVQLGGARVCGFGPRRTQVEARLSGAGTQARASGRSDDGGGFKLELVDGAGKPVILAPGQQLTVAMADQTIATELPELTVNIDWAAGRVSGRAPARTDVSITDQGQGCLGIIDGSQTPFRYQGARADATGTFSTQYWQLVNLDELQVGVFGPDLHRFYRVVLRTKVRIHLGTAEVTGQSAPREALSITLVGPDGAELGRAIAMPDDDGIFTTALQDGSSRQVTTGAGQTVVIDKDHEQIRVPVEDIAFDFEPLNGLIGWSPPNRTVSASFRLNDGRVLTFPIRSDATGRIAYRAIDRPQRADWTFADVATIQLVLPTLGGHEIVAGLPIRHGEPTPTPWPDRRPFKVLLPLVLQVKK